MKRIVRKIPYIKNLEMRLQNETELANERFRKIEEKQKYEYAYNSLKSYVRSVEYRYSKYKRIFAIDTIGNIDVLVCIEWTDSFKNFKITLQKNNNLFDILGEANILIDKQRCELIDIKILKNERGKGYGTYLLKILDEFLQVNLVVEIYGRFHVLKDESDEKREKFYLKNGYQITGNKKKIYKRVGQ